MQTFADLTTPRYQLPFEQLPRGIVHFPPRVLESLEEMQERMRQRFSEDYLRLSLERSTLIYYYQDYPVAYRSVPGGIEVLAVGWEEASRYRNGRTDDVKVVQP